MLTGQLFFVVCCWAVWAADRPDFSLSLEFTPGTMDEAKRHLLEDVVTRVVTAALPDLDPTISGLLVRLEPTVSGAELRCTRPPLLKLDPAYIDHLLEFPREEMQVQALAFVLAHELGHLPDCRETMDAELEADRYAQALLLQILGPEAKYFFSLPLPAEYTEEEAGIIRALPQISTAAELETWATQCVQIQDYRFRQGRVYSEFINLNMTHGSEPRQWHGERPVPCAKHIDRMLQLHPDYHSAGLAPSHQHSVWLMEAVLAYASTPMERHAYLTRYESWVSQRSFSAELSAGADWAPLGQPAVGWRMSYSSVVHESPWVNAGLRLSYRELYNPEELSRTLLARTVGVELVDALVWPVSRRTVLGLGPSIGWEWDVLQAEGWARPRHQAVGGLEFFVDGQLGERVHLRGTFGGRSTLAVSPTVTLPSSITISYLP